jgi:hypothetical protein
MSLTTSPAGNSLLKMHKRRFAADRRSTSMKFTFFIALALSAGLASCAHISDEAFSRAPSQMAVAEIQAEIAVVTRKMNRIRSRPSLSGEMPQATTPVIYYYPEPNGGYYANYTRADIRPTSSSRGYLGAYDEVRLNELAQRRLALSMELRRRTQSQ